MSHDMNGHFEIFKMADNMAAKIYNLETSGSVGRALAWDRRVAR